MTVFQISAILFALFMTYVVSVHNKKNTLTNIEASWWYSVWGLFIVFAAFPDLLWDITDMLRFSRVFDLLVVSALMVLTVMIFSSYFKQKQIDKKIEELVRKEAIKRK